MSRLLKVVLSGAGQGLAHAKNTKGELRPYDTLRKRLIRSALATPVIAFGLHRFCVPWGEYGNAAHVYPLVLDAPLLRDRYLTNKASGPVPPPANSTEQKLQKLKKTEITLEELWDVIPMGDVIGIDIYGDTLKATIIIRRKVPEHANAFNKTTRPTFIQVLRNVNRIDFLVTYKRILEQATKHNFDVPAVVPVNVASQKALWWKNWISSQGVVDEVVKVERFFYHGH